MSNSRRSSISNHSQSNNLLDEIDQWERGTLLLVKQTADRARQRLMDLMMSSPKSIHDQDDSQRRRNSFDNSIHQLNTNLSSIRLNIIPIDWSSILCISIPSSIFNSNSFSQSEHLFIGGTLLTHDDQLKLNEFYGYRHQQWNLIYKSTRDGFTINDFHRCADNQGPTITLIETLDKYLFGGYTSISWNFHQGMKTSVNDQSAFLFTLINPHGILPRKYLIQSSGENAIISNGMGPIFGHYDINIYPNSNLNSQSLIQFPISYIDTTGKGYLTFTGSTYFTTTDIEIYRLTNHSYST